MKKIIYLFFVLLALQMGVKAQALYYPPSTGAWETTAPASLYWCQARIDSLYNYLAVKNTKSFIILKGGKIVLEKYFGTYQQDSIMYWASASKSLAGFMVGLGVQRGLVNVNAPVSQYLGIGWSTAPVAKENLITVRNLLTMTSGLEDNPPPPCDNEDSSKACLLYKVDAGTRWAYHTGAYKKTQDVVAAAANQNYNLVTNSWLKTKIGMGGIWIDQTYYSKARDMARFGLLNLGKGIWNNDTVMKDSSYFKSMTLTSQGFNQAYGYLWWLNGKSTFMNPGLQLVLNGPLIPNAPSDLYAALGKNDQKIYVVPSQQLVVVRQGMSAENVTFALSNFDNKLWQYISNLACDATYLSDLNVDTKQYRLVPNPSSESPFLEGASENTSCTVLNALGQSQELALQNGFVQTEGLNNGIYQVVAVDGLRLKQVLRLVKM